MFMVSCLDTMEALRSGIYFAIVVFGLVMIASWAWNCFRRNDNQPVPSAPHPSKVATCAVFSLLGPIAFGITQAEMAPSFVAVFAILVPWTAFWFWRLKQSLNF